MKSLKRALRKLQDDNVKLSKQLESLGLVVETEWVPWPACIQRPHALTPPVR